MRLRSWTAAFLVITFVLAACGGGSPGGGGTDDATFLTADPRGMAPAGGGSGDGAGGGVAAGPPSGGELADDPGAAAGDVSREILEADLTRVVGDTLYLLNSYRGLAIVDLATVTIVGRLPLRGWPQEMYVVGARGLVLLSDAKGEGQLVDVSLADPAHPSETARFALGGPSQTSRLVGDVLYAVTGGDVRSFHVGVTVAPVDVEALPLGGVFVHATDLFLAVAAPGAFLETSITFVDISDPAGTIAVRGSIELPGWMSDDTKMHAVGSQFRCVTHDWFDGGLSRLFTVDASDLDHPAIQGTLELARGEQLFATYFTDETAYIVTFEQVDPLWVVDLRDPFAPTIAGFLEVPGWSYQIAPYGDRLVALGVDFSGPGTTTVSLFDVSNPAAPALLDREDLGTGWSNAFSDRKGLGVFPAAGLVLVPFTGESDRLAVVNLSPSALSLRGWIDLSGPVLRGFPHARGLVGISSEEVVVADPTSLAVLGRVVIAEDVVDGARLPDGTLVTLVRLGRGGRLGDVSLPIVPDRCYPVGSHVAVTGYDETGRGAYVVDFSASPPALSGRFDLGSGGYWYPDPAGGIMRPDGIYTSVAADTLLTEDGRLVVSRVDYTVWNGTGGGGIDGGFPGGGGGGGGGVPMPLGGVRKGEAGAAGFVVIDVAGSRLEAPVSVDGVVTGFASEGDDLVYTVGGAASADGLGRPRMRHDLVRVDLPTRATLVTANVPGYVVAARGGLAFTLEETWDDGWTYATTVVAVDVDAGGTATVLSRLSLPQNAYGFTAAGATLYFTSTTYPDLPDFGGGGGGGGVDGIPPIDPGFPGGKGPNDFLGGEGIPGLPTTSLGVVRLSALLSFGPSIQTDVDYLSILLPEDGSLLLSRNGLTIERHDVSGPVATLDWTREVDGYPLTARADTTPGSYLVALGYSGLVTLP